MTSASGPLRLLFVCTGNICRSPTAEGVFRHLAAEAGLSRRFELDSAGTGSSHVGQHPDPRAISVARDNGVDISGLVARNVKNTDFANFDYILAMDGGHFRQLKAQAPAKARARVRMFLEHGDVPDPWYGDRIDFVEAYALIADGAAALLDTLARETTP